MKKRALLIGINKYRYLKEKGQLKGCVNDVLAIEETLEHQFGFDRNEITVLKDEAATRDGIISELKKLAAECEPNDVIVFHFSGHGSQRLSQIPGKPNGVEETIVPCDSGRKKHPNRDISDENIKAWVSHLAKKTSNITLFFDNCFSGSVVRHESTEQIRSVEKDDRIYDPSEELNQIDIFSPALENLSKLADCYSMIAACEKSEYAREYTKRIGNDEIRYGAFTYFLVQELGKFPKPATYDDLFEQLSLRLTAQYTLQHPQLEGIGNRLLFSGVKK
ncbi:MAG TPA: caspase family protein, partial [Pyrinomonadaceae bacterium]